MTAFRWGSARHVGQVRQVNQDHVLADDGLFAVADGMGGHRAGEVASEVAVDTIREHYDEPVPQRLVEAVEAANEAVVTLSRDNAELRGMGTTVSALALAREDDRDVLIVVNVGDSRTYLLRAESEELEQVTEDHSLVATLERQGQLTRDEAAVHPQRNILTRALGIDGRVLVDSWELEPVTGDRYLLCSDGLFNEVEEPVIASVLRRLADPDEAAAELVRLANEGGGRDNISVVIVDVIEADTDVGRAPGRDGRIVRVVHGETRDGAEAEAIPARPGGDRTDDEEGDGELPARKPADAPRSRLTWRVGLFAVALVAIVGATVAGVSYAMSNTFYVGLEGDEVVVFQGRPGGLLWLEPSVDVRTGITVDDVPASWENDLRRGIDAGSREEADRTVANLRDDIEASRPSPEGDDEADGDGGTGSGLGGALDGATGAEVQPTTTSPALP